MILFRSYDMKIEGFIRDLLLFLIGSLAMLSSKVLVMRKII